MCLKRATRVSIGKLEYMSMRRENRNTQVNALELRREYGGFDHRRNGLGEYC